MSLESDAKKRFESDAQIEAVVRGFESCARAPSEFSHAEHLTVAIYYLTQSTLTDSLERLRDNLHRFLSHHREDLNVYNETVTLFWLKRLQSFLDSKNPRPPLVALANEMLDSFARSALIYDYYSRERLATQEARSAWVEPDLRPLDF